MRPIRYEPMLLIYKLLAAAGLTLVLLTSAYVKGRSDANAVCRADELRSQIEALQRDIAVQKEADAFEAAALRELEADNAQKDMEIDLYVKKLAERPPDSRCLLDDDDIGGLRTFGPR